MINSNIYIALLRGINVGGNRKVPMAELRTLLTNSGFNDVKTYIQSGNVIFSSKEKNHSKIESLISKAIRANFGFEVAVLVKTRKELQAIFRNCPFADDEKINSYFVLLRTKPSNEDMITASQKTYPDDQLSITKDCIYLYPSKGYGKSKFNLSFFERALHTEATARNYNTMLKLLSLSDI